MKAKLTTFGNWLLEALSNIFKALGGIFLTVLALVLLAVLIVPAFIWLVVVSIQNKEKKKARGFLRGIKEFFVGIACSFDQTGNIAFGGFFTWLFLDDSADYFFGDPSETISFVLGWNQRDGGLSDTGIMLVSILDFIDKDHCRKALDSGLEKAHLKINRYHQVKS